jgi:intraflagellar transport protein 56
MASCFFLLKQFDDVLVYMSSIKSYFNSDDDFHWNNALACASTGDYKEAELSFLAIRN